MIINRENIALITGAGSGIGKELAFQVSKMNYHVLLLGRKVNHLEKVHDRIKTDKGVSTTINLDLKDFEGIDRLGFEIFKKFKKLDLLILNAGVLGTLSPLSHQDPSEFEEVIKINLISNFRLIRSMEPLLKNSDKAKVIFISSGAAKNPKAYWGAYSISKIALEQMAKIWQVENKSNNIQIEIVNPGATRTKMRAMAMPGEDPNLIPSASENAKKILSILN